MIKSFRHKGLALFFATGEIKRIQPKQTKRLRLILSMLHAAANIRQMGAQGLRLHPLKEPLIKSVIPAKAGQKRIAR